ncbi:MAG: class I SAM-dependent methyltransferase [Bacteriovorax sp.]|jgi:2-polyprenyl-3-methyl-5-hydroxy-6-metoxy-1,4-benzoquinol methylase
MFQLTKFYEQCFEDFYHGNLHLFGDEKDLDKIRSLCTDLFMEIDRKRFEKSRYNVFHFIDHATWTKKMEHLDDPLFNVELKKKIVEGLHLKNIVCGTYTKTISVLQKLIEEINKTENRPARLLEIGSGIGKLTMSVYEQFQKSSLRVEMTGSDIVAEYVEAANLEADHLQYDINFKVIDAYHLNGLEANSYDIVFTLHSMHHFSPEQLSMIMSGARSVATRAFIGIDGYRGIGNIFFMVFSGAMKSLMSFSLIYFHDSLISARRMYSGKQLEIMARLSCPFSNIVAERLSPGLTVIKIFN